MPLLTCRELIDFLMAYVEDELSPDERQAFEEHLAVCPDCVHYLDAYRATGRALRAAWADPGDAVPEEVPADLVTAILASRRRS